ncbi:MAG: hypothetical protein MJ090_04445 [Clostridia bacterium]|nr:hypothetical protein [Clostridia bacterium]
MLSNLYKKILVSFDNRKFAFIKLKTAIAEDVAIFSKRKFYNTVKWTKEQKAEFDAYWKRIYGKKISDKWHRLYEASSGKFCINYIPEKMYTTLIETTLNDRRYARCLDDKFMVELLSKNCGCVVPETVGGCTGNRYFGCDRKPIDKKTLIDILKNTENSVIKPTSGSSSGQGILFFDSLSDKTDKEIENIIDSYGEHFIIQKKIEQNPVFSALNDSSINTVRITTYIVDGEIYHVPLFFRIGRKGKLVDNVHAGGLCIGVTDDGSLSKEAYLLGYGDNSKKYTSHPDSNIKFEGYILPNMKEIIAAAYKVQSNMPATNIVSWDFTLDKDNNPVLIEANIMGQGIWASQMIHGKGPFGEQTEKIIKEIRNGRK